MKSIFVSLCVLLITLNGFGQTEPLKKALKDLKKDLSKTSRASVEKRNSTVFISKKFNDCKVSYYFIRPNQNPVTYIEFAPISSRTSTFSNGNNPVYISDSSGGLYRNESLSRSNRKNKDSDDFKQPATLRGTFFDFKFVPMDSILIEPTADKKFFRLAFNLKEETDEYKINEKYSIYLKSGSLKKAEETLAKFKNVASLCQEPKK